MFFRGPLANYGGPWTTGVRDAASAAGKSSATRGLMRRASGSRYLRGAAIGMGAVGASSLYVKHRRMNGITSQPSNGNYPTGIYGM